MSHCLYMSHPSPRVTPASQVWLKTKKLGELDAQDFQELKSRGFSDSQIARSVGE